MRVTERMKEKKEATMWLHSYDENRARSLQRKMSKVGKCNGPHNNWKLHYMMAKLQKTAY